MENLNKKKVSRLAFKNCGVILLIATVVFIAYKEALYNQFAWDDYFIIVYNDFIKSLRHLPLLFSKRYITLPNEIAMTGMYDVGSGEVSYRPVVTLTYFVDYFFWKLNPFGFHLTNFFLHFLNTILLVALLKNFFRRQRVALLCGLIFATHPATVETVCNIAFREDLLVFLFYISAFMLFIKSSHAKGKQRCWVQRASYLCYFLALFSKEMAITLPIVLLGYLYFFVFNNHISRAFRRLTLRYRGYLWITFFYLIIRFFVFYAEQGPKGVILGGTAYSHILSMLNILANYFKWLFWPADIRIIVPEDTSFFVFSLFSFQAVMSILFLGTIVFLAFKLRRRAAIVSFSIFWMLAVLLPVMNIIPLQNYMAARYLYLVLVGFCLLIGWTLSKISEWLGRDSRTRRLRLLPDLLLVLFVFFYTSQIHKQVKIWYDDFTFDEYLVKIAPHVPRIRVALADIYLDHGMEQKALQEYRAGISMDPTYAKGYLGLANIYRQHKDYEQAILMIKKAIKMRPDEWVAQAVLANLYLEMKKYDEAMKYYLYVAKAAPNYLRAYVNMGTIYYIRGERQKAKLLWLRALEINPEDVRARHNLKILKREEGR